MKMKDRISEYIYSKRGEITDVLKRLITIPSVRSAPTDGAPYGIDCRRALDETDRIYSSYGLPGQYDAENKYLLTYYRNGEKTIGIFSHCDVVPAAEGWTVTKPFAPLELDGAIFGRGSVDDKSGIVAALFTACAIRDLKIPLHSNLLLFTGSNEESGMDDIAKFAAVEKMPDVSLVLDCAFPVYRGEKGIIRFWARSKKRLQYIKDIIGGDAFNIVLGKVKMTLPYNDEVLDSLRTVKELTVTVEKESLILEANGISKHAALPEGSVNALSVLLDALDKNGISLYDDNEILSALCSVLNDCYGKEIESFAMENKNFGKNSIVNGMVRVEDGYLCLAYDIRHINEDAEKILGGLERFFEGLGFDIQIVRNSDGFIIDKDDRYLRSLLNVYEDATGIKDPMPCINAGGTYARYLKNAFSTGTCLGNPCPIQLPVGHGGVHQPDEYINIDKLSDAIVVIAKMIIALDKELSRQ